MANGNYTADCRICKHHYFESDTSNSKTRIPKCSLWDFCIPRGKEQDPSLEYLLPIEEISSVLNLLCTNWTPVEEATEEATFAMNKVFSQLEDGILYAVAYTDLNDPSLYRKVCILRR